MDKPVIVSDKTFEEEVLKSDLPVLVDFWAPWCGPCKMIGPIIEELAREYAGKIKICKLNVDDNGATATQYGVFSIPTLILFKDGTIVDRMIGFHPKTKLAEKLAAHVGL